MDTSPLSGSRSRVEDQARRMDEMTNRGVGRIPSSVFFWGAVASVAISATLRLLGRKNDAVFVGEWPPTLMAAAIFTRINETRR